MTVSVAQNMGENHETLPSHHRSPGLTSAPREVTSIQKLWVGPHWDTGSRQVEFIKRRSYRIRMGPESSEWHPCGRAMWRHGHREKPREDRGRDWRGASTNQGSPGIGGHQELEEEHGAGPSIGSSWGAWPASTSSLDFWLLQL